MSTGLVQSRMERFAPDPPDFVSEGGLCRVWVVFTCLGSLAINGSYERGPRGKQVCLLPVAMNR